MAAPPPAFPKPAPVAGAGRPTKFAPALALPKLAHRAGGGEPCCDDCARHAPVAQAAFAGTPAPRFAAPAPVFAATIVQPSKKKAKGKKAAAAEKYNQAALNWKRYKCYSENSAAQLMKSYGYDEDAIVRKMVGCGLGTQAAYPGHCSGKKGSGKNNATPGKLEAILNCLDG